MIHLDRTDQIMKHSSVIYDNLDLLLKLLTIQTTDELLDHWYIKLISEGTVAFSFSYVNLGVYLLRDRGSFWRRCGSRIWSRGGPQLPRPKVADVAERSRASEASYLRPGSRVHLRALEAFEFLVLKYAFSHILEPLFLSFLISTSRPKTYNY